MDDEDEDNDIGDRLSHIVHINYQRGQRNADNLHNEMKVKQAVRQLENMSEVLVGQDHHLFGFRVSLLTDLQKALAFNTLTKQESRVAFLAAEYENMFRRLGADPSTRAFLG